MAKPPAWPDLTPGESVRLGIVTSWFNEEITNAMRQDALREARELQARVIVDVRVPGVFDLPLTVSRVLRRRDVDGVVAIGAVIKGETRHDEVVAFEAARQLAHLALQHDKPVGMGITGPGQSEAQARARVGRGGWAVRSVCLQFKTLATLGKRDAGTR